MESNIIIFNKSLLTSNVFFLIAIGESIGCKSSSEEKVELFYLSGFACLYFCTENIKEK
jgi:hypothetical protein